MASSSSSSSSTYSTISLLPNSLSLPKNLDARPNSEGYLFPSHSGLHSSSADVDFDNQAKIIDENYRPPSLHVLSRTDPSPLVSVADFAAQSALLKNAPLWDPLLNEACASVDIDTAGPSYTTAGKVGQLIDEAVSKFLPKLGDLKNKDDVHPRQLTSLLLSKITIPTVEDIERSHKSARLESLTAEVKKSSHRPEVNYISPFLQSNARSDLSTINPDDVILSVAVVQPGESMKAKAQEFLVLGSQPLHVLKDSIYCLSNHTLGGAQRKSGFFLIENTFYSDMRHPQNVDYASYLLDSDPLASSRFMQQKMEETRFQDLVLSVGTPYLYVHQGDCQHTIVVTEIRQVQSYDCRFQSAYPLQVFQCKIRRKKCRICDIFASRYVTYNDKLAPDNPCFFCDNCYVDFHYGTDGVILYDDFEVFPYYHS